MTDRRDLASSRRWWSRHDGRTAYMDDYCEDMGKLEEPVPIAIPVQMEVCPTCDGRGKYVNPDIDRHGLGREDFDEDPGFAADYFSGTFDVQCEHCQGNNVVPWPINQDHQKMVDEYLEGMEMEYEYLDSEF